EVLRRAGGPVGVVSRTHEPRHLRRLAEYPDGEGGVRRALQVLVEHDVLGEDRAAGAVVALPREHEPVVGAGETRVRVRCGEERARGVDRAGRCAKVIATGLERLLAAI